MAVERFRLVKGTPEIRLCDEAASQSFKRGDLVVLSSGAVTICTGTSQGAAGIYGVAMADASGTTGADVPIYVVSPEQIWRAFVGTANLPSSYTIGLDYKLSQTAAAKGYVLNTAGADAVICDYDRDDSTTTGGTILIRFDVDVCLGSIGA